MLANLFCGERLQAADDQDKPLLTTTPCPYMWTGETGAIRIRKAGTGVQLSPIAYSISQCYFICVRLCASLFGAVIRRLEHAELYILAVSGVPRSRVHILLLREISRVTFAPTEKCPCDANGRCGTSVTIIVGEPTGPSAHSSSVSVSQARLAHGEALPLHFSL